MLKDAEQFRDVHSLRYFWQLIRKDKITIVSLYLFIGLLLLTFGGALIAPYASHMQFVGAELMPPSWSASGQVKHFFGTDDLGRDLLSRILAGFFYDVGGALLITLAIALIGGFFGILAGLNRNRLAILRHLFDAFLFMPILLIAIIFATLMEPSLLNAMLAIFFAMLPHFIHHVFSAVHYELEKEYVLSLKLDGASKWDLVKLVILPNLNNKIILSLAHVFIISVLDISALGFISLGAAAGTPEWGVMIRESMELMFIAPWTVLLPGLAIIFPIVVISLLSNGISRALTALLQR